MYIPKIAWSYSVLTSFESCAWRHYILRVSKQVVEKKSEHQVWGERVHKAFEHRILKKTPMPAGMEAYEKYVTPLESHPGELVAEQKMALNAAFEPVTWFAKDVWVRGITDVTKFSESGTRAFIGDWKTGRPDPDSAQLRLTAVMTMHQRPEVEQVTNAFVWLKTGTITREAFTRDQIPSIWQGFAPRVARLEHAMATNQWPKKPSGLCRNWCPVGKALCEHCGS